MGTHKKQRCFQRTCQHCSCVFLTGAASKHFCSPECRVLFEAANFRDSADCWDWPKSKNVQSGYGQLSTWIDGKRKLLTAHVVSYRAHNGPTEGLFVCHSCDNPACFSPSHLFLGTQLDNMTDMIAKGRSKHLVGQDRHSAKLTNEQAISIRSDPRKPGEIAVQYGLNRSTIEAIKSGRTWRHLPKF
jgi:hypothetical protein